MRRGVLCLLLSCVAASAQPVPSKKILIRGTYSHPKPFWDKGARLDEYGVNAIFVHGGSINEQLVERAEAEGAKVYAEFATLNGRNYVDKHPEAWPINEKGERAPAATWFMGACPTEPGFRAYRLKQLNDLLDSYDVAGIWMDYFHWHAQFEDPNPVLPETCFSDSCLAAFRSATGIAIPEGTTAEKARWILTHREKEWRAWRVSVLIDWAKTFRDVIRQKRPGALLGVYHCPWTDDEFNGARLRILGLDLDRLAEVVDVFSPMVYHGRMQRRPEWVGEYVSWLSGRLGDRARIWPIVQAHNDPYEISAEEFAQVMTLGLSGRATGIMMFTIRSVAEDQRKLEALKRFYLPLK